MESFGSRSDEFSTTFWTDEEGIFHPKDHWTLKTGYFEDPTPVIQVQTLPLEGPRSLGQQEIFKTTKSRRRNQEISFRDFSAEKIQPGSLVPGLLHVFIIYSNGKIA